VRNTKYSFAIFVADLAVGAVTFGPECLQGFTIHLENKNKKYWLRHEIQY
jgi:hypothetical protein